jgi:hypothetical protein
MDNHFHLVVETPKANLARGMRQLNGRYAQCFNRRHRRVGHLFQGRYKAFLVERGPHLLGVCRYTVLNPERTRSPRRYDTYPWSSYRATAALEPAPPWLDIEQLLGQFAADRRLAQRRYRAFVRAGVDNPQPRRSKARSTLPSMPTSAAAAATPTVQRRSRAHSVNRSGSRSSSSFAPTTNTRSAAPTEKAATPCAKSPTSSASTTAPSAADSPPRNSAGADHVALQDLTPRLVSELRVYPDEATQREAAWGHVITQWTTISRSVQFSRLLVAGPRRAAKQ